MLELAVPLLVPVLEIVGFPTRQVVDGRIFVNLKVIGDDFDDFLPVSFQ